MTVRLVRSDDYDQWLPLWNGYGFFYERTGPKAIPAEITKLTWSRFLESKEPMHALVAEAGGALVGFAHYIFHRNTTMAKPTCYLQDLFTAENARGKGVATALIRAVFEQAAAHGSGRVYWRTHESNAPARRLYDKLAQRSGFIVYRNELSTQPAAYLF